MGSSVLMNVAIVGINQVYDKKLDRVNKPYLPMAAGVFGSDAALTVIAVCAAGSLVVGRGFHSYSSTSQLNLSRLRHWYHPIYPHVSTSVHHACR